MKQFVKTFELRWADVDANQHVMHSKYYELGAHCRMSYLIQHGLTTDLLRKHQIGVILFREECVFRRELNAGELVQVTMLLTQCRSDASRWNVRHDIIKEDGQLAAVIHADLAWMDLTIRKLTVPPPMVTAIIEAMPKAAEFKLIDDVIS